MTEISILYSAAVQHYRAGQLTAAAALCRQHLTAVPTSVEACYLLGVIGYRQGQYDVAIEYLGRTVAFDGTNAIYQCNLGAALHEAGRLDAAAATYRRALELAPGSLPALNNLGNVLRQQGKLDDAAACFRQALDSTPEYPAALNNLGLVLQDQDRWDEAIACHRRVLAFKPHDVDASGNLGAALGAQGKLDDAVLVLRQAVAANPDSAKLHNNLGFTLQCQRKFAAALDCYDRALHLQPDYALAHFNRAVVWLLQGDWARGLPEYEWRRRLKEYTGVDRGPWTMDRELAGKTVLLYADGGIGDTIQCIRYAPLLKRQGATVIVECQDALVPLLEGIAGVDRLVGLSAGADFSACDARVPILSMPYLFASTVDTIPADIPYLVPRAELVERWRMRLKSLGGFTVGIAWQGNVKYRHDRWRSIPLHQFAPLAAVPGVRLISLQKGRGSEQLAEVRDRFPVVDLSGELDVTVPFLDTAAVMCSLDLVIAPNSALAHLAGALGVPAWLALPSAPDWRWPPDRRDSSWYPTLRLFHQETWGDWSGVFAAMQAELTSFAASSQSSPSNPR